MHVSKDLIWFDGERVKNLNNGPRPVKLSCQWDVSRVVVRTKPQLAGGARPQPTDHRPQTRRRRAMRDCKSPCLRVRKFERIWKPSYQTDQKKSIRLLQKTTRGQLKDCKEAIRNEALFRGPAHFCDSSATMGFIIPAITPGHRPVWMCGTICMVVTRAVILWHFQISNELPFGSCSRRAWTIPSQQKPAQPPPQHHPRVVRIAYQPPPLSSLSARAVCRVLWIVSVDRSMVGEQTVVTGACHGVISVLCVRLYESSSRFWPHGFG